MLVFLRRTFYRKACSDFWLKGEQKQHFCVEEPEMN